MIKKKGHHELVLWKILAHEVETRMGEILRVG
jgi:hypothetical protein